MDNLDNLKKLIWFDPQKCFIDGVWQDPNSNNYLPLINPSSGKEICRIARCSDQDVKFKTLFLIKAPPLNEVSSLTTKISG